MEDFEIQKSIGIRGKMILSGAITSAKLNLLCDPSVKIDVGKDRPLVKQCPCCGSRFFESEICIYCNTPRF